MLAEKKAELAGASEVFQKAPLSCADFAFIEV